MAISDFLMIPVNIMYSLFKNGWTTLIIISLIGFIIFMIWKG